MAFTEQTDRLWQDVLMLKGFKDFLFRGNVVDLAVAVVMGAALTAVVAAFTGAFLTPLITLVTGGEENGGKFTVNGVDFPYGTFIDAVITFVLTAIVIYFIVVLPVKTIMERMKRQEEAKKDEQLELLREIRDELRRENSAS
ncbi:large conductance mechanosensitive channel protein MscL [Phytomonospora endophytica]|uniref:Large-conductance mechanosensitive channel n=1 Tax=Phytomonospora endophytica TaxID=714109 RepID=A0A841G5H8_9ACTN|nr:large conductance mechanosensitive channel protein MscL [Phytomonospora endophytica]MBB6040019.1 large conductance mechanosensitive channel [Phytomonospora endophytica]GIG67512.1 large-conductance mechanosensitive channel [Phytomonospora endophytica]